MGMEVLHFLHVFSDGIPRYSTSVLLNIQLVSCILFSSVVLLWCFFFVLNTPCIHFLI